MDLKKDKYFGTLLPQHDKTPKLIVLSLGAGVQSSTMALMAAEGHIQPMPDCAIFADTGYEPKAVYRYLEFLEKVLPYPVYRVQKGNIRDDMLAAKELLPKAVFELPVVIAVPALIPIAVL